MSIMDTVKAHPYLTAGGVFVIGLVLVVILAGGNGDPVASAAPAPSIVADSSGLQIAQVQAAVATAGIGAQLQADLAQTAAAKELGQLEMNYRTTSDSLAASVATSQINAQSDTAKFISTLSAQNEADRIQAQRHIADGQIAATVTMAQVSADTMKYIEGAHTAATRDIALRSFDSADWSLEVQRQANGAAERLTTQKQANDYWLEMESFRLANNKAAYANEREAQRISNFFGMASWAGTQKNVTMLADGTVSYVNPPK